LDDNFRAVADALRTARATLRAIEPPRKWLAANDLAGAYAIQRHNHVRRLEQGQRRIGRKIGLTSLAVQRQLGVDQPDFGWLFDDMLYRGDGVRVPTTKFLQPKIEGEIAFILERDITESRLPRESLIAAAGSAAVAFEIVDSAIADWKITLADTVADNASCGALVLGSESRPVADIDLRLAGMVLSEDDVPVSLGVGAASLGNPLAALAWLADLAIDQGEPLRRGEIILSGALGPMVPFVAGRCYRLEVAGFAPLLAFAE
jgi:2-keto-4-pentenoate hydratase